MKAKVAKKPKMQPSGGAMLVVVFAAALLATTCMVGCSTTKQSPTSEDRIRVVATTTHICDYVSNIVQPAADTEKSLTFIKNEPGGKTTTIGQSGGAQTTLELTCLLSPNGSAHDHETTVKQMAALAAADFLFINGVDLEHFLDDAVVASGFAGTMVVTSGVLGAEDQGNTTGSFAIDRGRSKVNVAPWPFPAGRGEQAEFVYDPHVWTSPKNAAIQASNIGDTLVAEVPTLEPYVINYTHALLDLDKWVRDSLATVPKNQRVLFTSHDAFGYFSSEYGVDFLGAALSDFNEQQDATAEHIRTATEQVKKSGSQAIFAENSNNAKSVEAIAKAAGVRAVVGEDALYGDSLGPAGSLGETYVKSIIHNVSSMVEAWGGTVAPLPDSLR